MSRVVAFLLVLACIIGRADTTETPPPWPGDGWRAAHRIIDLHQHINGTEEHLRRAVAIMDRVGIGVAANLSGGTVTSKDGQPSAFEKLQSLGNRIAPDRFVLYFNLDYTGWDEPDFTARAVQQVERAHQLGAAGLKEYKRLGLFLRDGRGELIRIDDPKLDPVWKRCGELGLPVSIHVADPRAFWLGYDPNNERWKELKEWAPNNEALDLRIRKPEFDFQWSSRMDWRVRHTPGGREWTCEVRIPLEALSDRKPEPGTRWRANFYRIDRAHRAFLASNPVLNGSFHTHDRFGWLEFVR